MSDNNLEALKKSILEDGIIDSDEVTKLQEVLYADGIIDKDEADFLFELNDAVSGKDNAPEWAGLFAGALADYVLHDDDSPWVIDDEETDYLINKIQGDGVVDEVELGLLLHLVNTAGKTTEKFQQFVLDSYKAFILEDGVIDAKEVEAIRTVIYGSGGVGGADVDRIEADWLFDLNDAVTGKDNHFSWKDLMVEAITKHVLQDSDTPGEWDDEEIKWLKTRMEGDGVIDDVEEAILENIQRVMMEGPLAEMGLSKLDDYLGDLTKASDE